MQSRKIQMRLNIDKGLPNFANRSQFPLCFIYSTIAYPKQIGDPARLKFFDTMHLIPVQNITKEFAHLILHLGASAQVTA